MTRYTSARSIDECSVVVDNLGDDGKRAGVRSLSEVHYSTDLYESLESFVLQAESVHCLKRMM